MYPDLPRKQRETAILQECAAVFIIGIGWTLKDGYPHEMRAADYDDWVTPTVSADGRQVHGLNGDILVWNHVTGRRHELTSMGVRVNDKTLRQQLEMTGQLDFLNYPYHRAILNHELPLSVGGGIGQSRTLMLLLRKAHLGEVSVTVWPKVLKEMCAANDAFDFRVFFAFAMASIHLFQSARASRARPEFGSRAMARRNAAPASTCLAISAYSKPISRHTSDVCESCASMVRPEANSSKPSFGRACSTCCKYGIATLQRRSSTNWSTRFA